MHRIYYHRRSAYIAVEFVAAMCFLLPIVAVVGWAVYEASQAYQIYCMLNQCASWGARKLAIAYGQNPTGTMANPSPYFNNITYGNIVNNSQQFSIPAGGWQPAGIPPTVTVNCTYQSDQHGCPHFPAPDPLNLGSNFTLVGQATYRLE